MRRRSKGGKACRTPSPPPLRVVPWSCQTLLAGVTSHMRKGLQLWSPPPTIRTELFAFGLAGGPSTRRALSPRYVGRRCTARRAIPLVLPSSRAWIVLSVAVYEKSSLLLRRCAPALVPWTGRSSISAQTRVLIAHACRIACATTFEQIWSGTGTRHTAPAVACEVRVLGLASHAIRTQRIWLTMLLSANGRTELAYNR